MNFEKGENFIALYLSATKTDMAINYLHNPFLTD